MDLLRKTAILFILMASLNSCKQNPKNKKVDDQSAEQPSPAVADNKPAHFSFTLKALVKEADFFQLFYIQENIENYTPDRVLSEEIVGREQFQEITFDMPTQFYPFNIRLDLGTNPIQSSIKIEECRLKYGTNEYVIKGSELKDYFIFNAGVEMLSDSLTFKLKTFKEGIKDKYDPFLMGNHRMNEVLLKKL